MTQFDVCRTHGSAGAPYLVILQSDLAARLDTAVVAPLWPLESQPMPIRKLQPIVTIKAGEHVLSVQEMLSIPRSALGAVVDNVRHERAAIIAALDLLFTGY